MTTPENPPNPAAAQPLFETSLTADVIHNREIPFPPSYGYHSIPSHVFDRTPLGLELQLASRETVSGLMAALPQWNISPSPSAVDSKPWRVIWPSHPILNTWSKGSGTTPNCDKFKSTEELQEETLAELPPGLDQYGAAALIYPLYRIIAYHTVQPIRFLELQLSQRDPAPYFLDLKLPDRGPVPPVPPDVVARITQADHHAMQVMQGHQTAYNELELKKYCKKYDVAFPSPSSSSTTSQATGPPLPPQQTILQSQKPSLHLQHVQSLLP